MKRDSFDQLLLIEWRLYLLHGTEYDIFSFLFS